MSASSSSNYKLHQMSDKKMGVEVPEAIISTCSKNRWNVILKFCSVKTCICFHIFWNHYHIIDGKFTFFHTSQPKIAKKGLILPIFPSFLPQAAASPQLSTFKVFQQNTIMRQLLGSYRAIIRSGSENMLSLVI